MVDGFAENDSRNSIHLGNHPQLEIPSSARITLSAGVATAVPGADVEAADLVRCADASLFVTNFVCFVSLVFQTMR